MNGSPRLTLVAAAALLTWLPDATAFAEQAAPEPAPTPVAATPATTDGTAEPAASDTATEILALEAAVAELKAKAEEAELAALMASTEEAAPVETEQPIRVYGFMDFGMDKMFVGDDADGDGVSLLRPTPANSFIFGNLNLYFDASPLEGLRSLIELRVTTAPHGEEISLGPPLGTSYERTDTLAFDFSAPSAQTQLRLGSIFIERAWTQYELSPLFKLQWGLFLNPFGIWNIDHGSPTLISLMLPTFVSSQMMPTRLLGVNLYGSTYSGSTELGYAVHITNGRTPTDFDMTEDKAIGGRFYVAHDGDFGRLVLGTSGYIGTYDDLQKVIVAQPDNTFDWVADVAYAEQIIGFDVALDVGDLRVRSEAVMRWIQYDKGKSERIFTPDGSEQYLPSRMEYSGYALAAYRTPWRLEPYVEVEISSKSFVLPRYAGKSRATQSNVATITSSVGLNLEIAPNLLVKGQLAYVNAFDDTFHNNSLNAWMSFVRVVTTF